MEMYGSSLYLHYCKVTVKHSLYILALMFNYAYVWKHVLYVVTFIVWVYIVCLCLTFGQNKTGTRSKDVNTCGYNFRQLLCLFPSAAHLFGLILYIITEG